jgi:hypothetical protein
MPLASNLERAFRQPSKFIALRIPCAWFAVNDYVRGTGAPPKIQKR